MSERREESRVAGGGVRESVVGTGGNIAEEVGLAGDVGSVGRTAAGPPLAKGGPSEEEFRRPRLGAAGHAGVPAARGGVIRAEVGGDPRRAAGEPVFQVAFGDENGRRFDVTVGDRAVAAADLAGNVRRPFDAPDQRREPAGTGEPDAAGPHGGGVDVAVVMGQVWGDEFRDVGGPKVGQPKERYYGGERVAGGGRFG